MNANRDQFWLRIAYSISLVVCAAVCFLMFGPRPVNTNLPDVSMLPAVNATLNATTACLLTAGFWAIRNKKIDVHRRLMLAAFTTSAAFLVSYVIYHWYSQGPRAYLGAYKTAYLFILMTHIVLAAVILPLSLVTLYRGLSMQRPEHRKLAKITLPLWLYVSVSGVVVYVMLYL